MMFGQDKDELRRMYVDAWRKSENDEPLSALEAQIAAVVREHPEYQAMLKPELLAADFTPEQGQSNPFLHMGLHLAIRDQLATDRPPGIRNIFNKIVAKSTNAHEAEHKALDCLAETLWEAQRSNAAPDEQAYLERLERL